jgi:hypothetical protein
MLHRRLMLIVAAVLALGVVTAYWLARPAPSPFRQKYNQIRLGMGWKEVTDVLGPPGMSQTPNGPLKPPAVCYWRDSKTGECIRLVYDKCELAGPEVVVEKSCLPQSLWEMPAEACESFHSWLGPSASYQPLPNKGAGRPPGPPGTGQLR